MTDPQPPSNPAALRAQVEALPISATARAFAAFCGRQHLALAGPDRSLDEALLVALGGAAACRDLSDGHVCVDLATLAGQLVNPEPETEGSEGETDDATDSASTEGAPADPPPPRFPALPAWRAALRASPLVTDAAGAPAPLVLDDADRLYLHRYWAYEDRLAEALAAWGTTARDVDEDWLEARVSALFTPGPEVLAACGGTDHQADAARTAARRGLTVVTGGPGTGKTTTVVRLLAILVEQALAADAPPPRIALLAPTGKAAARMGDSVKAQRQGLPCDDAVKAAIPDQGATLHRALGWQPRTPSRFRHDASHPLPYDVVVVDEASMVPQALMAKLVDAVAPDARLVLLGDRDQLASVEPGAVLGDLCSSAALDDAVVTLSYSYRSAEHPAIGKLAAAVNQDRAADALALLADDDAPAVRLTEPPTTDKGEPAPVGRTVAALRRRLEASILPALESYLDTTDPAEAFRHFDAVRVLCAHRRGPLGVERLNELIVALLSAKRGLDTRAPFYRHRPVMVTENDHGMKLYNGDVGLVLPAGPGRDDLRAWFPGQDGTPRSVPLGRLPPHETAFALTVHKSQGSEFDRVLVVLPDRPSPLLGRELLYTGITRARSAVEIFGHPAVLRSAIGQPTVRVSGLQDALARHAAGSAPQPAA